MQITNEQLKAINLSAYKRGLKAGILLSVVVVLLSILIK